MPRRPSSPKANRIFNREHQRLHCGAIAACLAIRLALPVLGGGQLLALRPTDTDLLYPHAQHLLASLRRSISVIGADQFSNDTGALDRIADGRRQLNGVCRVALPVRSGW